MSQIMLNLRQGNYQKAIDGARSQSALSAEDQAALVGAHSFLGHLEEATQIWRAHGESLTGLHRIQARFFLGVALTRVSKFKKAKLLFKANLDAAQTSAERAFAFQGAGFYSYFRGNFNSAKHWSEKALSQAAKARETFAEYLAMDLLGHSVVQAGKRSQGLRLIQTAKTLAEAQKNRNFSAAFSDARLIYESEAGLRPTHIIAELQDALANPQLADSYTRGNLVLELARQWTLRGRFEEAKSLLNREAPSIYALGNRRQEVMLQFRLAEISHHQGDFHLMAHLLQSAKKTVALLADKAFEIRLLGLSLKLPAEVWAADHARMTARLLEISKDHSSRINRQILARQGLWENPRTPAGEDPLHDLLSLAQSDLPAAQERCLELGYLGIYRQISDMKPGARFLEIISADRGFIAGGPEEIRIVKSPLSAQQIKLLRILAQGPASKEQLIAKVWGYAYHPLRHDSLIHNAIGKLRKALGPFAAWVLTNETGWSWDSRVRVSFEMQEPSANSETSAMENNFLMNHEDLNFRQIKALRTAPAETGWSVSHYKKTFGVSTMTAFRDLTHLQSKGLVLRRGRARACRYLIPKEI